MSDKTSKTNKEIAKEEKTKKGVMAIIEGKMDLYGMTKKTIYSVAGILGCLVLTIVMSITGMGFDPAVFFTWNYWTGMIVQFGIAIFAMITGKQIGDDTNRNKPNGQYRVELKRYKAEYDIIDARSIFDYFDTWLEIYREKKLEKKIIQTLREFGMKQNELLDLDLRDIPNLENPWVKNWEGTPFYEKYYNPKTGESKTIFKSLSETQREALRSIMTGAVKVSYVSPSYFMNALKGTATDEWERAARADKKRAGQLASGYTYRIFAILIFSVITNGLITVPYASAGEVALNIASRLFVLVTSVVWGIYLGFKIVEMDQVFLAYKTYILKLYREDSEKGKFQHETIEEEAKRELDEYNEKQAKAVESVVEPTIENPEDNGIIMLGLRKDE